MTGNHWFLGEIADGKPKPVWDDLTAAWSPKSISIELWDRNFLPGDKLSFPLYLFNNSEGKTSFKIKLSICDSDQKIYEEKNLVYNDILQSSSEVRLQEMKLPDDTGKYIIKAELINRDDNIRYPVISKWEINIFRPVVSLSLKSAIVGADEPELISFLEDNKITRVPLSDPSARIILMSEEGWKMLSKADQPFIKKLEHSINSGISAIILDAGERYLGQGYPADKNNLGPLQAVSNRSNTPVKTYDLFGGIRLSFNEAAEPESHIHPDRNNSSLWRNIPLDHTWLWNGMRGGLIVPATNFDCTGLGSEAFLSQWLPRGAEESRISEGKYYAYSLEGIYEFSSSPEDNPARERLKNKVDFLIQDAPALANSLNANAPVKVTDLTKGYKESGNGIGKELIPLVNAGKSLTRTPVVMIKTGSGSGNIIVHSFLQPADFQKNLVRKAYMGSGMILLQYSL